MDTSPAPASHPATPLAGPTQLHERDELLRLLGDNIADGLCVAGPDGAITYWNAAAERMFGFGAAEVLGRRFWEIVIPPAARAAVAEDYLASIAAGCPPRPAFESEGLRKDNTRYPFELALSCIVLQGRPHGIAILRDISGRRAAEAARWELTERLLEAQRLARMGAWEFDPVAGRSRWTDEVFRLFERDPALGVPSYEAFVALIDPEDRGRVEAALASALTAAGPVKFTYRIRVPSGAIRYVETVLFFTLEAEERTESVRGTIQDVTEITLAQQENRRLVQDLAERVDELSTLRRISVLLQDGDRPIEAVFQAVVEALPAAMRHADVAAARLFVGGHAALTANWRDSAWIMGVAVGGAAGAGKLEVAYLAERPAAFDGPFLADERGMLETVAEMLTNHLERRRAEASLRAREAFLASVVETVPDVLYKATLPDFVSTFVSPSVEALLGYPAADFLADPGLWARLTLEDDRARVQADLARELRHQDRFRSEYRMRHRDGSTVYWVQDNLIVSRGANGEPVEVVGCMTDVTSLKRTQEELAAVNRALRTLSEVNEAVIRAESEADLMVEVCRIMADVGGFRLAWIGIKEHDERRTLRVAAADGAAAAELRELTLTWRAEGLGLGPSGTAAREGQVRVSPRLPNELPALAWPGVAQGMGLASVAAFPLAVGDEVVGCLTLAAAREDFVDQEVAMLERLSHNLAYGLRALRTSAERDAAVVDRERHMARLQQALHEVVRAIVATMEVRDPYTAGHQQRVADLCQAIALRMGLCEDRVHGLHLAAMVHDIGKIQVPQEILARPGRLSELEFAFVKVHPQVGYDILKGIDFPWPIAEIVYQHHERLGGEGYPRGLAGDAILLEARILAIADTVEAMASHRPYRAALGIEAALAEIGAGRGTRYDADAVDACLDVFARGYRIAD